MGFLDALARLVARLFGSRNDRLVRTLYPLVEAINRHDYEYRRLGDSELREKTKEFRGRLAAGETPDDLLPEAFAAVKNACRRLYGRTWLRAGEEIRWEIVPYDVQLIGGIGLHRGKIAEMVTGEGKTLVATFPAYLNALEGKGVHIVTVNDFLARRDRDWMGSIYETLGLTVGAIQNDMMNPDRKAAYACDITYGTNSEFGFDYLRDNMKIFLEEQVQRGLNYAIIDEVDSILIDEARTPLIISGSAEEATDRYFQADRAVRRLKQGEHLEVNEKDHHVTLTEAGIESCQRFLEVEDFYTGENMDWPHFLDNALKANHLYRRDDEYVLKDGKVIIVDEFTGRMMPGRRWSDGLHQAIEAKEGLRLQEENQTLATITIQNYFRMYKKLGGMTGTAVTEAPEFDKIYKLDVLVIPPNRPLIRATFPDVVWLSEDAKLTALEEEIFEVHRIGRPILVGTISVEKSEKLSQRLLMRGIKHEVLNAKQHEREAHIVAKAGQLGMTTIATNMAGRGTDIVLGRMPREELLAHWQREKLAPENLRADDPEVQDKLERHWESEKILEKWETLGASRNWTENGKARRGIPLCEGVAGLGGLHIVGTERHEARRIDNQLRGRAGRQGDPGSSRFFLSLQDDLMRIFAPEWVSGFMKKMGMKDDECIESRLVSKRIQQAQRRREEHNFEVRKHLLEYDEVMDEQRKLVYGQRTDVLKGEGLKEMVQKWIDNVTDGFLDPVYAERDRLQAEDAAPPPARVARWAAAKFGFASEPADFEGIEKEEARERILAKVKEAYETKERELGAGDMRFLERFLLLEAIDSRWKEHLHAMDELKSGIGMRGYGQVDPKIEYKKEGYELFEQMIKAIKEEVTDLILKVRVKREEERKLASRWAISDMIHQETAPFALPPGMAPPRGGPLPEGAEVEVVKPIRAERKTGRNEPCPCGSGKKYKKCCGRVGGG